MMALGVCAWKFLLRVDNHVSRVIGSSWSKQLTGMNGERWELKPTRTVSLGDVVKPAYYMRFTAGHHGSQDRIGGLPSHLPSAAPVWEVTGNELVFLAQFSCHPERLPLADSLCLQLYQNAESYVSDDNNPAQYEPYVTAVLLPSAAPPNTAGMGRPCPNLRPFDIAWEYREDLDDFKSDYARVIGSKAQGTCCFANYLAPNERLLITLEEYPLGFNFGGSTLFVLINVKGDLEARLDR
jgi:hypothetical protein